MPKKLSENENLARRIAIRLGLSDPTRIGVGNWCPGVVLLVGEQSAHPKDSHNQQPFCDLRACSGWLNAQLEQAKIPEERLYWINALNNDGTEIDLQNIVAMLKPSATIALGRTAERLCSRTILGMPFHALPHPQYWKRFHHFKPYPLIKTINDLPVRSVSINNEVSDILALVVNGHVVRRANSMSSLIRIKEASERHKLPASLRLPASEWLRLDLGLTDNETVQVKYFDDLVGKIPFRVI